MTSKTKLSGSEAAAALGKLGAAKGGRARASVMTDQERRESASVAARARWKRPEDSVPPPSMRAIALPGGVASPAPYSMFQGLLDLGEIKLKCHVLNDRRRVFTQREVVNVLAGYRHGGLERYLERNPLTANLVEERETIPFTVPKESPCIGYEAKFVVRVCLAYARAWDQGLLDKRQLPIVRRANVLVGGCAEVGINALVDEATGYQEFRAKEDLQVKMKAFIAEEMQEWARMFPTEFWVQLARLEGIHYSPRSRPLRWGKYVMEFVYDAIDKDVGNKLREINPDPRRGRNHHQWLASFGKDELTKQLWQVIGVMKGCSAMAEFKGKFSHLFRGKPFQLSLQ